MDIGSIFPLYNISINNDVDAKNYELYNNEWNNRFSLCREALFVIAQKKYKNKIVLIPAYTCSTVYEPFVQCGWSCIFYKINKDLTINTDYLLEKYLKNKPSICVIHPFYGMDFDSLELETIKKIQNLGCIIVEDITQSIFKSIKGDSDYYVGSLRKWFPIPDGAFIHSNVYKICDEKNNLEFTEFVQDQIDAMYLRGKYFELGDENIKQISIRLNKRAVKSSYNKIKTHKMSTISENLLAGENLQIQVKRYNNFCFLYNNIKFNKYIEPVIKNIERVKYPPLYFPIYSKKRSELQKILADHHIYAPILWPKGDLLDIEDDDTNYIYRSILMLPIDQRYNDKDMEFICNIINKEFL